MEHMYLFNVQLVHIKALSQQVNCPMNPLNCESMYKTIGDFTEGLRHGAILFNCGSTNIMYIIANNSLKLTT